MVVKNIAIIGAGWSGLQISKVLTDCGFSVTVFEELDDVGGTWHPQMAYAGLAIHAPIYRCQFVDAEVNKNQDLMKRLKAIDVFENCKSFVKENKLERLFHFNKKIIALNYHSQNKKCTLTIEDLNNKNTYELDFDFVINTQFNAPRMPQFKTQKAFAGTILHTSEVKDSNVDEFIKNKKNVVILGASKAATDMAYLLCLRNYNFKWLFRKMYWFQNYDNLFYNHKTGKPVSYFYRYLYIIGTIMQLSSRKLVWPALMLWKLTGMLHMPSKKVHFDFKKYHGGILDEHQVQTLRNQTHQVIGEIDYLDGNRIVLKDKTSIDCDVLICATGCDPIAYPIKLSIDKKPFEYENIKHVYRYSVIPEIPRLCFTGFAFFSFGPLNGYHRAGWIMKYLEKDLDTQQLIQICKEESPELDGSLWRKQFIFDSSDYFGTRSQKITELLSKDVYSKSDGLRFLYNGCIRFKMEPYKGIDTYIKSKVNVRPKNN